MDHLYQKLQWRLMPLFCICIILNYLDRTSLAFASIQMTQQLQFSPEVLGLGGGLFFISYCLMQVGVTLRSFNLSIRFVYVLGSVRQGPLLAGILTGWHTPGSHG